MLRLLEGAGIINLTEIAVPVATVFATMASALYIIISRLTSAVANSRLFREGVGAVLNLWKGVLKVVWTFIGWLDKLSKKLRISKETRT